MTGRGFRAVQRARASELVPTRAEARELVRESIGWALGCRPSSTARVIASMGEAFAGTMRAAMGPTRPAWQPPAGARSAWEAAGHVVVNVESAGEVVAVMCLGCDWHREAS